MVLEARFKLPPRLPKLVQQYADREPGGVRFRLASWTEALKAVPGNPTRHLTDSRSTTESTVRRYRDADDRVVSRSDVLQRCSALDFNDDEAVVAAFILVMVWGSRTSNAQSPSNASKALRDVSGAAAALRDAALTCRAVDNLGDPALRDAHRRFALPGVGEAFLTKWLAFAGQAPGRDWQPLILDTRVRATLHVTLDVWLNRLTDRRNDRDRYVAYVAAMHHWAERLGNAVTAARLEWIMSTHNGQSI